MTIWKTLNNAAENVKNRDILSLFDDPKRADNFSARFDDMLFDFSKTNIDTETLNQLVKLADQKKVAAYRDAMFNGEKINMTENRAVRHTALRNIDGDPVMVGGADVMPEIRTTLERMEEFAAGIRAGRMRGQGGKYTDVVNIGIGGSDLGPAMACLALAPYHSGPKIHFVSNIDGAHITDVLKPLNPETTLVIVASKTFTTIETMTNARTAFGWMTGVVNNPANQFAALSSSQDKTADFGIANERVFGFEDWVGGRYSLWGPIGMSLMIAIGPENFRDFLRGGAEMDTHFKTAEFDKNLPVLLALVGLWHHQLCGYPTRAVLPYDQRLSRLPAYFQQLEMESNGKGVTMDGAELLHASGPIVWGEPGTNGQHAFYQLIHQGTAIVPCEFMVAAQGHEDDLRHHHRLLLANCLAQSKALMHGRSFETAKELMAAKGFEGDELVMQANHRVFKGNRPSTTLIYPKLTPNMLGRIIALYEHRVFVEGVILGVNSFDQWGVELGKELAVALEPILIGQTRADDKDSSTRLLVDYILDLE